ncbi:MAG: HDOD domain-containing protein [Methylovulum sp.]|nr:HDOD domain-containing protein [Methylovulum sp.]
MNWFTKLFSRYLTPPRTSKKTSDVKPVSVNNPYLCTEPVAINTQKIPLSLLKKFVPIRGLDDISFGNLNQQTLTFTPGSVVFRLGQPRDSVYYLLQGRIALQPDGDKSYSLADDSPMANLPLSSGKTFGATATAITDVTILAISGDIIQMWTKNSRKQVSSLKSLELELPDPLADDPFFSAFSKAFRENKLRLPSLPHVAIKLKKAMLNDIGIKEVVNIIQIDAPIVTRLIQIANSALYVTESDITNCHGAVTRLGLDITRNLVTSMGMKQMFHCKNPRLMKIMQTLWKDSLYISSLSYVLAEECSAVNPEDALLAGLICNIGVIPILHFAEEYPDELTALEKLQSAITLLGPSVGTLVLQKLGFSEELASIPMHAENWFYESDEYSVNLIDIVIMAKLHSYIGSERNKALPFINTIPAYAKLKNGKLSPDFSLHALHKAKQRINTVTKIFF